MLQVSLDFPFLIRKTRIDNPEKFVTLGTQDEEKQEWTIQRNLQHWVHKTGLSILVFLGFVYPMLQVSLGCPFLFVFVLCTQCSRMDNPEKLVT
jgi:hypothetical protein